MWICLLTPGASPDELIRDSQGPHWAKGHFKDHEAGAQLYCALNCAKSLGRRAVIQCVWPRRLLSLGPILGGGKNQDVPGVLTAKVACGASTPPNPTKVPRRHTLQHSTRPCSRPPQIPIGGVRPFSGGGCGGACECRVCGDQSVSTREPVQGLPRHIGTPYGPRLCCCR